MPQTTISVASWFPTASTVHLPVKSIQEQDRQPVGGPMVAGARRRGARAATCTGARGTVGAGSGEERPEYPEPTRRKLRLVDVDLCWGVTEADATAIHAGWSAAAGSFHPMPDHLLSFESPVTRRRGRLGFGDAG